MGEEGADGHAADQDQADRVSRDGAGAGDQGEGEVAGDSGDAGHDAQRISSLRLWTAQSRR
jgi:hypothetical protein